jgi:hypothetical protein
MENKTISIATKNLFDAINILKKNIEQANKSAKIMADINVLGNKLYGMTQQYNNIVDLLGNELGTVSHFSVWIHVDYLAPYFNHKEIAKRARENRNFKEENLNRLHLRDDEFADFCNEAWGKLLDDNPNGLFRDPGLKKWYELFPDSMVIFHKENHHDGFRETDTESDRAMEKIKGTKFDSDRYYYLGNESVGSHYEYRF